MTADEAREWGRRHGWDEALERIADEAPPPPPEAIEMLRLTGYGRPAGNSDSVKQAPAPPVRATASHPQAAGGAS